MAAKPMPLKIDGIAPGATRTTIFSKEKLSELAQNEENKVYDYEYDSVDRILPMDEVLLKIKAIRGIVMKNKNANPDWNWKSHKEYLQKEYPELFAMARSHPKIFDVVSHPASDTQRDIIPIFMQIKVKKLLEEGKVTEEEAMKLVSTSLQNHFKMEKGKTKNDVTPWGVSNRPG